MPKPEESIRKKFGARVRELRRSRNLTQEALSEAAQLHQTYLAEVEAGKRNLGLVNVVFLAKALGVHPSELFMGMSDEFIERLPMTNRNASRSRREK